jgi:hypothetical protein
MTFQYVQPTEEQKALMQEFRDEFAALADKVNARLADSRGRSLAVTKLEEAAFWLNKAITRNDARQDGQTA